MTTRLNNALFNRRCRLTIAAPVTTWDTRTAGAASPSALPDGSIGPPPSAAGPPAPTVTQNVLTSIITLDDPVGLGLQVAFKVSRTLQKEPNTSEITVSNFGEATRRLLQHKGVKVKLEAGYVDTGVTTIFEGDVRTVDHVKDKADWHTILRLGDGERSFRFSRAALSFGPGTSAGDVLRAVANATGLLPGNVANAARALDSTVFQQGYVVTGSAHRALERLVKSLGWSYSIQSGALQVLAPGQILGDSIPLISEDTGLIGSPEMGTPEQNGKPVLCKFKSLLIPTRPGAVVHLKSDRYDTDVVVKKCSFDGDTHGGEWTTIIYGELRR